MRTPHNETVAPPSTDADAGPERTCVLTRACRPKDALIRLALAMTTEWKWVGASTPTRGASKPAPGPILAGLRAGNIANTSVQAFERGAANS